MCLPHVAKKLSLLISQSLTAEEDTALCSYLEDNPSLTCQELLVMLHIQRSRYVEAIRVNRQLNDRQRTLHDPQVWKRSDRRNAIVEGISKCLPDCIKSLAQTDPTAIQPRYPSQPTQCMKLYLKLHYFTLLTFVFSSSAAADVNSCCSRS